MSGPNLSTFRGGNLTYQMYSMAGEVRVNDRKIIASASEYDAWLASLPLDSRARRGVDGRKLHRIVQMRRNGCSTREVGEIVGLNKTAVSRWLRMLPEGLSA